MAGPTGRQTLPSGFRIDGFASTRTSPSTQLRLTSFVAIIRDSLEQHHVQLLFSYMFLQGF